MARELSGSPELPKFSDRLPDLVLSLRQVGRELAQCPPAQSYLPYWEDLYTVVHSLKGVLKILSCPEDLAQFILRLNETLLDALAGKSICRRTKDAGAAFSTLADLLDFANLKEIDLRKLSEWLAHLQSLYTVDIPHEERRKAIPPHLFHVSELVTKKARETDLLQMNQCMVEDEILLDDIAFWRSQLNECLTSPEFGRGLLINFLPFISPEGSRKLRVWAWVSAATHSRAALKQRIKEIMPKVKLAKS
jgi:hypothetical protein